MQKFYLTRAAKRLRSENCSLLAERESRLLHMTRGLLDTIRLEKRTLSIEIGFDELLVVVGEREPTEHLRPPEGRIAFYERLDGDALPMPRPEATHGDARPANDRTAAEEIFSHLDVRMMNTNRGKREAHPTRRSANKGRGKSEWPRTSPSTQNARPAFPIRPSWVLPSTPRSEPVPG